MIKEEEIRIGNYFYYENNLIRWNKNWWDIISDNDIELITLSPVKLNTKWLVDFLNFTFSESILNYYSFKNELHSISKIEGDKCYLFHPFFSNRNTIKIRYVHQLQNLLFELSGENYEEETTRIE